MLPLGVEAVDGSYWVAGIDGTGAWRLLEMTTAGDPTGAASDVNTVAEALGIAPENAGSLVFMGGSSQSQVVAGLKDIYPGDILVAGSATLIDGLREHDLVDEYRLTLYPVILGQGKKLFKEGTASSDLTLVESLKAGPAVQLLATDLRAGTNDGLNPLPISDASNVLNQPTTNSAIAGCNLSGG